MGQFKPMVKMETTEPSVILKLKKGGSVSHKAMKGDGHGHKPMNAKHKFDGGAMGALAGTPALIGRPAVNAPVATPGRPNMAARRQAMMAKKPMPSALMSKKGGMAEGGAETKAEMKADKAQDKAMIKKAFKEHDAQEHKGDKGTKLKLKKGGKMATGGVSDGQGGYKKGGVVRSGIIDTENQGGEYRNTKMHDGEKTDRSPANTGDVKLGNAGGFKTGGVAKANGGGYKKGGAAKKHFATGGKVSSGAPVAMPQGRKKPSAPVAISQLSGTFKKGGKVTPAEGRLLQNNKRENSTAMREAKEDSNEKYRKGGKVAHKAVGGNMSYGDGQVVPLPDAGRYVDTNGLPADYMNGVGHTFSPQEFNSMTGGLGRSMAAMPMPNDGYGYHEADSNVGRPWYQQARINAGDFGNGGGSA